MLWTYCFTSPKLNRHKSCHVTSEIRLQKEATSCSPSLATFLPWKPVAILWAALQRGPYCKKLWEVNSQRAQQPARDRNLPTAMCVNWGADLPSEEPFEKTTALVNALTMALYEILRKRHPAKSHLDFCSEKHGKIINVCCFKLLRIGVNF